MSSTQILKEHFAVKKKLCTIIHSPVITCPSRRHLFEHKILLICDLFSYSCGLMYRYITRRYISVNSISPLASPSSTLTGKKKNNNNNNNNSKQLPSLKRKMQINIFFFLFKSSLGLGIHYLGCTVTISEISVADLIGRLRLKGVSFSCWRWATFAVEVITMGCCLSVDNELRKGSKERKDH